MLCIHIRVCCIQRLGIDDDELYNIDIWWMLWLVPAKIARATNRRSYNLYSISLISLPTWTLYIGCIHISLYWDWFLANDRTVLIRTLRRQLEHHDVLHFCVLRIVYLSRHHTNPAGVVRINRKLFSCYRYQLPRCYRKCKHSLPDAESTSRRWGY